MTISARLPRRTLRFRRQDVGNYDTYTSASLFRLTFCLMLDPTRRPFPHEFSRRVHSELTVPR